MTQVEAVITAISSMYLILLVAVIIRYFKDKR